MNVKKYSRMNRIAIKMLVAAFVFAGISACDRVKEREADQQIKADWQKQGPGGGGSTFIPTFSWHDAAHFLVRCDMTGSYLTTNGGQSYKQVDFPNGASGYAYDPLDSNTIYIGSAVLSRSKDAGKTWHTLFPRQEDITGTTFMGDHAGYSVQTLQDALYEGDGGSVTNICVDPAIAGALYFCMGRFFFYTADEGKTWRKEDCGAPITFIYTNSGLIKKEVVIFTAEKQFNFNKTTKSLSAKKMPLAVSSAFSFTGGTTKNNEQVIFYALRQDSMQPIDGEFGHTELWLSKDMGGSWQQATNAAVLNTTAGIRPSYSMIACAANDAEKAYLVTNRYEERRDGSMVFWYGALKTNDAGDTWNWVWKGGGGSGQYGVKDGMGVANLKDAWVEKAFGGEYIRLIDAGVYPNDGDIAIVTDWYRTMKTTDGGRSWNEIYSKPQNDGSYTSNGMDVTTTYGVHFDPFDSNHIAISYTDIGYHHSYNKGKSWIRSTEGVPVEWVNTCYWVVFDPQVKDKVWSAWSGMHDFPRGKMTRNPKWKERAKGGICVSADGGKTWKPSSEGMGFDAPATCIVMDSRSAPGNRTLYASVYNKGVFKSTDDGKTWTLKNRGIEKNTCAFELTLTDKGDLFLTVSPVPVHSGGMKGRAFYTGAVYKSVDGAATWQKLNVSDGLLFPNGMAYDPKNSDRIYLACWADIDLSDLVGGDVARSTGGNEILKMPGGVFLSEDAGATWTSIFDKKQYVYDVTADPYHEGRLYINTFNQAAYRSDDYGKTWKKLQGYDFHWGHRAVIDPNDTAKIYLTTFGSSVWHGSSVTE